MSKNQHVLTAYEHAARIYCDKRDLDPDLMLPDPTPASIIGLGPNLLPQWHFIADEMHDLSLRLLSLKEGSAMAAASLKTEVH